MSYACHVKQDARLVSHDQTLGRRADKIYPFNNKSIKLDSFPSDEISCQGGQI